MAEIGSSSGTSYPTTLDTNTNLEVDSPSASKTLARAAVPNDLGAIAVAVETTLGTTPQGTAADVKTYLQVEHNTDGTHKWIHDAKTSTTDVNTTVSETDLYSKSIIAGTLSTNHALRLTAFLDIRNDTGVARTATIKVKFGTTTLYTSPATSFNDAGTARYHMLLLVDLQATGATNTQASMVRYFISNSAVADAVTSAFNTNSQIGRHYSITEDTTSAKTLSVTVTLSASDATLSCRCVGARLEWMT